MNGVHRAAEILLLSALTCAGCGDAGGLTGEASTGGGEFPTETSSSSSTGPMPGTSTRGESSRGESSSDESSGDASSSGADPCTPNPCKNGGSCDAGSCACPPGFEGERCETNIDDCVEFSCMNGSACVDGVNEASCDCLPGFEGVICQVNIDECEGVECVNDGACIDGIDEFSCLCPIGYGGQFCECPYQHLFLPSSGSTPVLVESGITVTGSNDLYFSQALGIVGGTGDATVDPGEWVSFSFETPAERVNLNYSSWLDTDQDGIAGEGMVEAFGPDGSSLGVQPVPEDHGYLVFVTAMFADALISSVTVTATDDIFRLDGPTWVSATCD